MMFPDIMIMRTSALFFMPVFLIFLTGSPVLSYADPFCPGHETKNAPGEIETSDFGNKKLNDFEEERTYRKDNVVITVKKLYAGEKLYWNFEITVENGNDIKKTVDGALCLYNMYIHPRECGAEECGVRMAVRPKSVLVQKLRCKGKVDMNSWTFLIFKVHNY